ncbi:MAG: hypothetical protein M3O30_02010 [Planctomycetota bacterium]|nr:hypothetical protein [Planctomycetota bacterium]
MANKPRVLVVIPAKTDLHPLLKQRCMELALSLVGANPGLELGLFFDWTSEPKLQDDRYHGSKIARIRNRIVDSVDLGRWDHFLWVDADVVQYPADMPSSLLALNPNGVSAPLVLIEEMGNRFYDVAAFVIKGRDVVDPTNRTITLGRNLSHDPPYWWPASAMPKVGDSVAVPMDCVGTITMVPTMLYRKGVRYVDHPAFTEHYPICKAARDAGLPVTAHVNLLAYHACLPKYGENWH